MRRVLVWSALAVVTLLGAALIGGGWYYSEQLLEAPTPEQPELTVAILAADEQAGTVTLPADSDPDLLELEHVGLHTTAGLLLLDGDVRVRASEAIRRAELLSGDWPRPGDAGAPAVDTFAGDPAETLGLPFDTVEVHSELGPLPAWRVVPAGADRAGPWVVFVHGRGTHKTEGNRILAVASELGLPALSISIRNDPDAPAAPDGYGRYGDAEWEDLDAAVDHLRTVEDAQRFVLVGASQGGSIVLTFLRRSLHADRVDAVVLVSPLVSLDATLRLQASQRGIPDPLIEPLLTTTRWISTWRADIDFDRLEHLDALDELPDVPMLVTHGDADRTVPVEPSRRLASALDDRVTYVEYEGAGHVREWNVDRERFETQLHAFLAEVIDGR